MGVHTGLQVYQAGKDHFIAHGLDDATLYAKDNGVDEPKKLSDDIWFSQGMLDFLKTLPQEDAKQGGVLPGKGIYRVSSSETNMFQEQVPDYLVNAENPGRALEAIACISERETWQWYPTYMVEMLEPGASYTPNALNQLVTDILKEQD